MHIKTFVLLAGGKGTRLSELTKKIPKPAVTALGRPIISYLIDWATNNKINKIVICGGYLYESLLEAIVSDTSPRIQKNGVLRQGKCCALKLVGGIEILVINTGEDSATGERIRLVKDYINDEYFLCTYSDTLSDIRLLDIIGSVKTTPFLALATLGYPDARYGEIVTDGDYIVEFKEKAVPSFLINRGFYLFNQNIFSQINPDDSLEEHVLPRLAHEKKLLKHVSSSWFHSVDTILDLENLEKRLLK